MPKATMTTNHGEIVFELFEDDAPKTVDNLRTLADKGFYDGLTFHRIIRDFMIQGGCPLGTGTGGPGYTFDDEIHPDLRFDRPYLLAMANAGTQFGRGTNGSQFFVTVVPTPHLNRKHTIFGEVADDESKKVVDAIATTPTGSMDRPKEPVVINSVVIERLTV
jgi:peptidyl-prolyl cis-trans isomerase A (cyclophilin A)